jgi:hypothetical protein
MLMGTVDQDGWAIGNGMAAGFDRARRLDGALRGSAKVVCGSPTGVVGIFGTLDKPAAWCCGCRMAR